MRLTIAAFTIALLANTHGTVLAQEVGVTPDGPDEIDVVTGDFGNDEYESRPARPRPRSTEPRDLVRVRDVAFGTNDQGERCIRIVSVWVERSEAPPEDSENARIVRMSDRYPLCPDSDPLPEAPAPNVLADRLWHDEVSLPNPQPTVQPDDGITGIPVYLQIGGPQQGRWEFDVFDIEITIEATSTYDIDWGDGTPIQTGITSQGGPYPDGDIVHGYQFKGTYDIVVTQRWTATWTAQGPDVDDGGTIADVLQTVGTVDDFVVTEVQAVRER